MPYRQVLTTYLREVELLACIFLSIMAGNTIGKKGNENEM